MTPSEKQAFDLMREALEKFTQYEKAMDSGDNILGMIFYSKFSKKSKSALAAADAVAEQGPADQLPDAGKMAAALRAIADGTVAGGKFLTYFATVLAYQELARKTLETDAEIMAGSLTKYDGSYPVTSWRG